MLLSTGVRAGEEASEPETEPIYEEIVRTRAQPPGRKGLGGDELRAETGTNVGEALAEQPGVSAVRRGASLVDPVIRGLGGERIETRVGGVPVQGACPSRMDPPVSHFAPRAVERVELTRGVPTVTRGRLGLGGEIDVTLDFERPAGSPAGWHPGVFTTLDTSRGGYGTGVVLEGGGEDLDLRGGASWLSLGDYRSGAGRRVPAGHDQLDSHLTMGWRLCPHQRLFGALLLTHQRNVDTPSLPMDNRVTTTWIFNGGYRLEPSGSRLKRLEARIGLARVDHRMDNRDKPNRSMLVATTPSRSDSFAGGLTARWRLTADLTLDTGLDFTLLERDAVRERRPVGKPKVFYDHIWPAAAQRGVGFFTEALWRPAPDWRLRVGVRVDEVSSTAAAVDDPSLGGLTIREQYARFFGPEAARVDRAEPLIAGLGLVQWRPLPTLRFHLGGGLQMRAPGITERYFAFGPAPGGYRVGNPALGAEQKWLVDGGLELRFDFLRLAITGFYAWVGDFILATGLPTGDVNGDGLADVVRGYENVDAHLAGGELAATVRPLSFLSFPLVLSAVWAENLTAQQPLPEIPPVSGSAAVRVDGRWEPVALWALVGVRLVAPQERISEAFGENRTDGFALLDARAGISLFEQIHLVLRAENLLDSEYVEHLTPPAPFSAGDIPAGEDIPNPGFRLSVALWARL